jgi:hypothetical protein
VFIYSTVKGRPEKVGQAGAGSRREAEGKRSGSGMEAERKRNGSGAVPTEAERKRNGSGRKRNGNGTEAERNRNGSGTDGNGDCDGLILGRLFSSWCYEKKHARLIVDIRPSCWPKKTGVVVVDCKKTCMIVWLNKNMQGWLLKKHARLIV